MSNVQPEIDEFDNPAISSISAENEGFKVDDDQKADWALRKLAVIRRKQAENKNIFDAEVIRITEWLSAVNTALDKDALYFEAVLTPYALTERFNGRKSLVLPHGTVKTTAGRPKIEIQNEVEFLAWAEKSEPELIRIKKEIDKKVLNALLTDSGDVISTQGEIVPSVRVIPAETSVSFVIAD
jgi:phage host-nuclease inhibitor protein Gam